MRRLLIAVGIVALAACSGGDDDAVTTEAPSPAPVTAPAPATTDAPPDTEPPDTTVATPTTAAPTTIAATTQPPTTTTPPTTVPPTTAAPQTGTRDNPIPLATFVEVGDGWSMRVNSANLDATQLILGDNQFTDPPAEGNVYVIVNITARYDGADASSNAGVQVNLLGTGTNAAIDQAYTSPPGERYNSSVELFQGGETTGEIVFEVSPADLGSLVAIGQAYFAFDDDSRAFFALQ